MRGSSSERVRLSKELLRRPDVVPERHVRVEHRRSTCKLTEALRFRHGAEGGEGGTALVGRAAARSMGGPDLEECRGLKLDPISGVKSTAGRTRKILILIYGSTYNLHCTLARTHVRAHARDNRRIQATPAASSMLATSHTFTRGQPRTSPRRSSCASRRRHASLSTTRTPRRDRRCTTSLSLVCR